MYRINRKIELQREENNFYIYVSSLNIKLSVSCQLFDIIMELLKGQRKFDISIFDSCDFELLLASFVIVPEYIDFEIPHISLEHESFLSGEKIEVTDLPNLRKRSYILVHTPIESTQCKDIGVDNGGFWVKKMLSQTLLTGKLASFDFNVASSEIGIPLYDLGKITFDNSIETMSNLGEKIELLSSIIHELDLIPIFLGGDHLLTLYSMKPVIARHENIGIIQFDAHTDFYGEMSADVTTNHANFMHHLSNRHNVKKIVQIGLRDLVASSGSIYPEEIIHKVQILSSYSAFFGGIKSIFNNLDKELKWYITFDVDCMENCDIPETATPVLGGLKFYDVLSFYEYSSQHLDVVGLDFCEVGNGLPSANGSAAVVSSLILNFILLKECGGQRIIT